jgi:hypothetical protein
MLGCGMKTVSKRPLYIRFCMIQSEVFNGFSSSFSAVVLPFQSRLSPLIGQHPVMKQASKFM